MSRNGVKCQACGAENRAARLFCAKCGERLDPARVERALRDGGGGGFRRWAGRWMRRLALLAMAAGLVLALWPVKREEGETGTAVDARRYAMQRAMLADALENGREGQAEISEKDFNAFLAHHVRDGGAAGAWGAQYRGAGARFGAGGGEAWIEMARGPFRMSLEWSWSTEDGTLKTTGARFGHLPLPGAVGRWHAGLQKKLWAAFGEERRILEGASRVESREGTLAVRVGER